MTVEDLIHDLQNHDPAAELCVVWHGYLRVVEGTDVVQPGRVEIVNRPWTTQDENDWVAKFGREEA